MRLLCLLACAAAACRFDVSHHDGAARRPLPADLAQARAICYSGYRAGQSPDLGVFPSEDQIAEDLGLLARDGWRYLRLFDAGTHAERVLRAIAAARLDLKVVLGVWIAGDAAGHDAANRAEIDRAVALVAAHPDLVVAISVGNETLDDWSNVRTPPAELAAYLREVRARVAVPVTTDDSWLPFTLARDGDTSYEGVAAVIDAADFLSLHVYAYADAYYGGWNWNQNAGPQIDAAVAYSRDAVHQVRAVLAARGAALPIVVGEIGWKSATAYQASDPPEESIETQLADPAKQKAFVERIDRWARGPERDADSPDGAFFFEAFDEPWKGGDDGWGLYGVDRRPK